MIYYKTREEIELIRISSLLVGKTLAEVAKEIKPGVTTLQLDKIAEEFIQDNGATPSFKGYGGFPSSLCTSVNEAVVHGIPNNIPLKEDPKEASLNDLKNLSGELNNYLKTDLFIKEFPNLFNSINTNLLASLLTTFQ